MKWFTSDTHFSHANIIRYAARPFRDAAEMDAQLIANWNGLVAPTDTVFFLGDFGLGRVESLAAICEQLHGHKVCIRGNHDGSVAKLQRIGFQVVLESAFIKLGRHTVELIHIPSEAPPLHPQLHGHVHEKRPNQFVGHQLNLCVEVWDYKPVAEEVLVSSLDRTFRQAGSEPPSSSVALDSPI